MNLSPEIVRELSIELYDTAVCVIVMNHIKGEKIYRTILNLFKERNAKTDAAEWMKVHFRILNIIEFIYDVVAPLGADFTSKQAGIYTMTTYMEGIVCKYDCVLDATEVYNALSLC